MLRFRKWLESDGDNFPPQEQVPGWFSAWSPDDEPAAQTDMTDKLGELVRDHLDPQAVKRGKNYWVASVAGRYVCLHSWDGRTVRIDFDFLPGHEPTAAQSAVKPNASMAFRSLQGSTPAFMEKLGAFCLACKRNGFAIEAAGSDEKRTRVYAMGMERLGFRPRAGQPNVYEWTRLAENEEFTIGAWDDNPPNFSVPADAHRNLPGDGWELPQDFGKEVKDAEIDKLIRQHLDPKAKRRAANVWDATLLDRTVSLRSWGGDTLAIDFDFVASRQPPPEEAAEKVNGSPAYRSLQATTPAFMEKLGAFCLKCKEAGLRIQATGSDSKRQGIYNHGLERLGFKPTAQANVYEWSRRSAG